MLDSLSAVLPGRQPGRPSRYVDLLHRPISILGTGSCYPDWEQDHGGMRSFYVGGFRRFLYASGIDDFRAIVPFGAEAVREVRKSTDWTDMPESGNRWKECGLPQFKFARHKEATYFQKAVLTLVACERALAARLAKGEKTRVPMIPDDVYTFMSVIAACWHIEEFTPEQFRKLRSKCPQAELEIKEAAAQHDRAVLEHLTRGYTATFETVNTAREYIEANCRQVTIGKANPQPGRLLGHLGASVLESIDAK